MSDVANTKETVSAPTEGQHTLDLLHQLRESFKNGQSGMVFACGGTVPIPAVENTAQPSSAIAEAAKACQPVTLRWDPSSKSVPASECKLQFPLDMSDSTTEPNMQQLLHDMQPATFGYKGKDVLDESYRKAVKLEPSRFACTFSPYELGIFDEVEQILLPETIKASSEPNTERVNVMRAELYKLNVYEGPSGLFKPHVDTPRSTEQIGSLVVCLPSVHQGGELEVRHEGRTMKFDWSMPETARPEIQWAAFYSDCEHEVLQVTSGHRITLTYNLYASSSTSSQSKVGRGLMDPTQLPLYGILQEPLLRDDFMPDGGYLGVHTSHAYPHSNKFARLPATLKGADMAVWETFRSLGCGLTLRPVIKLPKWYHYGHDDEEPCPHADPKDPSSASCWVLGSGVRFRESGHLVEYGFEEMLDDWTLDDPLLRLRHAAPQAKRLFYTDVSWLNRSGINKEPQLTYAAYGNDTSAECFYSTCSIVVEVPPYTTRKALLGKE